MYLPIVSLKWFILNESTVWLLKCRSLGYTDQRNMFIVAFTTECYDLNNTSMIKTELTKNNSGL